MAISPNIPQVAVNNAQSNKQSADVAAKSKKNDVPQTAAEQRQAQNIAILRANEQVSLRSNNDSLALLYKAAIEGINAELEPVMGENAAQKIYDEGIDTSPQATADRIVAFSTAFYSRYKELNPAETEQQTLDNFMALITPGVEKGFADAKDILTNLKVYEGELESAVDSTFELVKKGLAAFREKMLELAANPPQQDDTKTSGANAAKTE